MELSFVATESDQGHSASTALRHHCNCSASLLKDIRLQGELFINGKAERMKTLLEPGDHVSAKAPQAEQPADLFVPPELRLLYQNSWLLALSKAPGWVVHPCLNKELPDLCSHLSLTPLHPVNRLDRDTTGIVLIALNGHAHYCLSQSTLEKKYHALIHGRLPCATGIISVPISRHPASIMLRRPSDSGKSAQTLWQEITYFPEANLSLVAFDLCTGRTHQIRVHSLYMGCPLLGDTLYGLSNPTICASSELFVSSERRAYFQATLAKTSAYTLDRTIARQALHAGHLTFTDPLNKQRVVLDDPLPEDMLAVLRSLT